MRILLLVFTIYFFPACVHSQSKLPISDVRITPSANYESMRGGKSSDKLRDGRLASSSLFWLDPNTLGWQGTGRITIDLTLEELSNINSITLRTAKNENADVLYPFNVNVFFSEDGKSYFFIDDIAAQQDNKSQGYQTLELRKDNIKENAKFVKLIIIPQGRMFFTDEILINGTKKRFTLTKPSTLSPTQMEDVIANNKTTVINRIQLLNQLNEAPNKTSDAWNELREEIVQADDLSSDASVSQYKQKITRLNIHPGKDGGLEIKFLDPEKPPASQVISVVNTNYYRSFEIINKQQEDVSVPLNIKESNSTHSALYEIQSIQTRSSRSVYDVLMPLKTGTVVRLSPGERKLFMTRTHSHKAGESRIDIQFAQQTLSYKLQSVDLGISRAFQDQVDLQVNVWPYYSTPFYEGKEQVVKADLKDHYVNIFTIPAWTLEPLNPTTDHKKLKDYLKLYNAGDKVLLFMSHDGYMKNPGDYLQESWKKRYLTWHDRVMKILEARGIPSDKIYLYPFDEVAGNEIQSFNTFSSWIKKTRPSSQIYVTVVDQNNVKKVQAQADIVQLLITKNQIDKVTLSAGQQYWIYDIMDDAKDTDPQLRYRAMAWNAYRANATGIGFWNYADMFGESVWDDLDGPKSDYNVVYDQGNSIVPSVRWEAFKQGIEEYFLLKKHEEKFGRSATLKIIGSSQSRSGNSQSNMDNFRRTIIERLR